MTEADPRTLLESMFRAAVAAASAEGSVPSRLPPVPAGRTVVVGAGKAAAAMAQAVETRWPADAPLSGLVVTRYQHGLPCKRIEVLEAGHPVPDAAGEDAARRILAMVQGLGPDDLVLCLVSGGASALLTLPAPGVSSTDKRAVNKALLASGASIDEINCVRKHLSAIKGGRLAAAAAPARVVTLLISDVPGDDPSVIGSGPTVPDPSTLAEARDVLARYGIDPQASVKARLDASDAETPKPGDPAFSHVETAIVATPRGSLDAAADVARRAGYRPLVLGDLIEGEAREVARVLAGIAKSAASAGTPVPPPLAIISGGETTVTVRGKGRGGRNAEFLLALAVALNSHPMIHALAADTDGIDGTEDNAGAFLAPDSLARAAAAGIDAKARLADNDGYGFFAGLGDLLITGPTRTNVNDFRVLLIGAP
jgi:glycerate 2-kinase